MPPGTPPRPLQLRVRPQLLLAGLRGPAQARPQDRDDQAGRQERKYRRGQLVWVTVGYRHEPREKVFTAVIDDVEVKRVRELSPRDIEHDNPEFRRVEDTVHFLEQIYGREVAHGGLRDRDPLLAGDREHRSARAARQRARARAGR